MQLDPATLALAIGGGLAAGMLAGLFGVGGGIVFVPILVMVFSFSQLSAQATSLAAIVPLAMVGAWRQSASDLVYWRGALIMGCGAAVGVLLGAEVATRLPNHILAQAFGVVLILVGGQMLISSIRTLRAKRASAPTADLHPL